MFNTVRLLSSTTSTKQEETAELADDNASTSTSKQTKLKGKQRWRARQRELRGEPVRVRDGDEQEPKNTIDVKDGIKQEEDVTKQYEDIDLDQVHDESESKHISSLPTHRRSSTVLPQDLPKPSYLRPSLQNILHKKLLQKHAQTPTTRKSNPGGDKLKDSMKTAPFQTAFAQNPYAHILASPVREDILSRVHLPMSCLLPFHVAELDQDPDVAEKEKENVPKNKAKKERERDRTVQYQLLPLSLAAELAPTGTHKSSPDLHDKKTYTDDSVNKEARSLRPTGSASYLSANYDALSFISKDTKRRLIPFTLSRRMHHEIGINRDMQPTHIKWRTDMPDFVLGALRSIVAKKLGYLLRSKGARDRPGLVYEVLGGGRDLSRLHHMQDVSCVIRLTPEDEEQYDSAPRTTTTTDYTWRDYPFLDNIMPLPSSQAYAQSSAAAEVVPYRNINIPVYSTHKLLGTKMANKIVAQTIFAQGGRSGTEDSVNDDGPLLKEPTKYVVLTRSSGTLQAQMWLSKLQNYVGNSSAVMEK